MAMSPFGLLGHELQTNLQDSLPALAAAWKFHDVKPDKPMLSNTNFSCVLVPHEIKSTLACNLCQSCQSLDSRRLLGMLPTLRSKEDGRTGLTGMKRVPIRDAALSSFWTYFPLKSFGVFAGADCLDCPSKIGSEAQEACPGASCSVQASFLRCSADSRRSGCAD